MERRLELTKTIGTPGRPIIYSLRYHTPTRQYCQQPIWLGAIECDDHYYLEGMTGHLKKNGIFGIVHTIKEADEILGPLAKKLSNKLLEKYNLEKITDLTDIPLKHI